MALTSNHLGCSPLHPKAPKDQSSGLGSLNLPELSCPALWMDIIVSLSLVLPLASSPALDLIHYHAILV